MNLNNWLEDTEHLRGELELSLHKAQEFDALRDEFDKLELKYDKLMQGIIYCI